MRSSHDVGVCGSREARRSISNHLIPADDGHVLVQVCAKHVRGTDGMPGCCNPPQGFRPQKWKGSPSQASSVSRLHATLTIVVDALWGSVRRALPLCTVCFKNL